MEIHSWYKLMIGHARAVSWGGKGRSKSKQKGDLMVDCALFGVYLEQSTRVGYCYGERHMLVTGTIAM